MFRDGRVCLSKAINPRGNSRRKRTANQMTTRIYEGKAPEEVLLAADRVSGLLMMTTMFLIKERLYRHKGIG